MRTQVEANYAADSLLFVGLRGVGKTVLLKEIRDRYNTAGWLATYVQIRPSVGVDRAFGELALRSGSSLRSGSKLLQAMKRLSKRGGSLQLLGQGIAVGPAGDQPEGYGELLEVLSKLGEAARDDGVGVALIVDELQSLKVAALGDLVSLVFALRDNVPLAFVGCGLNYLPSKIAKATTSTERLRYEPTDFLAEPDARRAVLEPAGDDGVSWDEEALRRVVAVAEGYPYFLQLYASESWAGANRRGAFDTVLAEDVDVAIPEVARQLDFGLYGSRFGKLGPNQREYVFAMEELMRVGGAPAQATVRSGDVARHLSKSPTDVSPVRDGLIRSGTIHAPAHGDLEFSVPGFADYLSRRRDPGEP